MALLSQGYLNKKRDLVFPLNVALPDLAWPDPAPLTVASPLRFEAQAHCSASQTGHAQGHHQASMHAASVGTVSLPQPIFPYIYSCLPFIAQL